MNKNQRKCLWAGIIIIGVMGVFPPFTFKSGYYLKYSPIFTSPKVQDAEYEYSGKIDFTRLSLQCGLVALLTGCSIFMLKDQKNNDQNWIIQNSPDLFIFSASKLRFLSPIQQLYHPKPIMQEKKRGYAMSVRRHLCTKPGSPSNIIRWHFLQFCTIGVRVRVLSESLNRLLTLVACVVAEWFESSFCPHWTQRAVSFLYNALISLPPRQSSPQLSYKRLYPEHSDSQGKIAKNARLAR